MKKLYLIFVLLFACTTQATPINLVTNGGFETGDLTGWYLDPSTPADRAGVTMLETSMLGNTFPPTGGNYFGFLHGDTLSGSAGISKLSQNIGDIPAGSELSFWYAYALRDIFLDNSAGFSLVGNEGNTYQQLISIVLPVPTGQDPIGDTLWTQIETMIPLSLSDAVLTFWNVNDWDKSAYGTLFLDDVEILAQTTSSNILAPETWYMVLVGIVFMWFSKRSMVTP